MSAFIKVNIISSCQDLSVQAVATLVNHNFIQVVGRDTQTGATSITLVDGKSALVSETQEQVLSLIHTSAFEQLEKAAARRKEMK